MAAKFAACNIFAISFIGRNSDDHGTTSRVTDCLPEIINCDGGKTVSEITEVTNGRANPAERSLFIVAMADGGRFGNSPAPITAPAEVRVICR